MSPAAGRFTPQEAVVFQKLDVGLYCRLTLLVALAGAGKTRVLHAWAAARQTSVHPLVWLELQPADNQPQQFLERLTTTLQPFLPDSLPTQMLSWTPGQESLLEAVIDLINAVTEAGVDFSLILDGYHAISDPFVHQAVELLLDYMPPSMHLIIASRCQPPLPIPRLRARRQLVEIGDEELTQAVVQFAACVKKT